MGITFWKSKSDRKPNRNGDVKQADSRAQAKSFRDQQQKEGAFDHRDRGIRTVPLNRIVGSGYSWAGVCGLAVVLVLLLYLT